MKIPPLVLNKLDSEQGIQGITLHCIIDFFLEKKKRLYCLFIDYEKAFDRVERAFWWQKLLDSGVAGRILTGWRGRERDTQCRTKVSRGRERERGRDKEKCQRE